MKNIFSSLFFIFSTVLLFGQQPTVSISCNNTSCFSPNPCGTAASYHATINDGAFGSYTRTIQWIPSADNQSVSGQGTPDYTVAWLNTTNAESIQVTVTYTDNTSTQKASVSNQKGVTVKYIGSLTSMSLSGGVSANPSNGSSLSVPCGSQSLTISVATPATNPATGVIYNWSLPSGWSGTSTSNSINVTTNAGGGGNVSVIAIRSDGTCNSDAYSFSANRPLAQQPSISAISPANDYAICVNETKYYNATATNATTYRWVITPESGTFTFSNVIGINPTSSSTLVAYANNACNVESTSSSSYQVYYGPPTVTNATVNGGPLQSPNYGANPFC